MQITHLGHSAVLVETDAARILIDPGNLSTDWQRLTDLDAILITHGHPDHVDPEHLPALREANPAAGCYAEAGCAEKFGAKPFAAGDQLAIGDLLITGVGGQHAVIHPDLPRIGNVGYVLTSAGQPAFFHPGDMLDTIPDGIDVLAVPLYGPWAAMKETIDFVRAVGALEGFPIHDGLLNERGWNLIFGRCNEMTSTRVIDLRGGSAHTF